MGVLEVVAFWRCLLVVWLVDFGKIWINTSMIVKQALDLLYRIYNRRRVGVHKILYHKIMDTKRHKIILKYVAQYRNGLVHFANTDLLILGVLSCIKHFRIVFSNAG